MEAASLKGFLLIKKMTIPKSLYHFTSKEGAAAIRSSGVIRPGSGLFGRGTYLTRFCSPFAAKIQGAKSVEVAITVTTEGLNISPTLFPGTYLVEGPIFLP